MYLLSRKSLNSSIKLSLKNYNKSNTGSSGFKYSTNGVPRPNVTSAFNNKNENKSIIDNENNNHENDKLIMKNDIKKIQTKQKFNNLPLTDTFGRNHTYLRISLTERCNLRCTYCMPAEGIKLTEQPKVLQTDEILYLARLFVEQGVRKIRLTGGEPTVRKDIVDIIKNLKEIPNLESVSITTNGIMLTRLLVPMQRAGLNLLNISLDTLKVNKYEKITRRRGWERVIAGIDLSCQLGYKPKINCVVMKDFNDDELCDFVEMSKEKNVDIRFIEYMPFTGNKWETGTMVSFKEMLDRIKEKFPNIKALENGPNDTSKAYAVPGYKGQIGFITSMSQHFCGTCNRLRLTADGNLKVCLFGNTEVSLRDAIRNKLPESELITLISNAVKRKKKQHADSYYLPNIRHASITAKSEAILIKNKMFANNSPANAFLLDISTKNNFKQFYANYSTFNKKLTHIDSDGNYKMVDVGDKKITERVAKAECIVRIDKQIKNLIINNLIKKGNVLSIAQLAGIIGGKRTSDIIPLCHNINLTMIDVQLQLDEDLNEICIQSVVKCHGKTGVEMEALTAVTIAALTVYDMCKAVSHHITINNIKLLEKSGGKSYFNYSNQNDVTQETENVINLKYNKEPIVVNEPFYPTHI